MRRCREYAFNFVNNNKMKNRKHWSFCETPEEKCTMNYCDDNGCQNRKRNYVQGNELIADVVGQSEQLCHCGKKEDSRYSPCCSLEHWYDKFS